MAWKLSEFNHLTRSRCGSCQFSAIKLFFVKIKQFRAIHLATWQHANCDFHVLICSFVTSGIYSNGNFLLNLYSAKKQCGLFLLSYYFIFSDYGFLNVRSWTCNKLQGKQTYLHISPKEGNCTHCLK